MANNNQSVMHVVYSVLVRNVCKMYVCVKDVVLVC